MAAFLKDEKLLIHCFQDSLTGSATRWYTQLTRANIRSWKDLSKAFVEQYKHVTDMTPNRIMLEGMEQKASESLRQYAQRWRDVAAQIQPPISEHEITPMFVNTLKGALFDRLINNTTQNFADMVRTGESIEVAIKSGRIDSGEHPRKNYKRKDNEINTAGTYNAPKNFTISTPQDATGSGQNLNKKESRPLRKENEKMTFTPLPISYAELYSQLYKADLVRPCYVAPFQPPYPPRYDGKAHCDYHAIVPGHSIENCTAFKRVVENMLKSGVLKLGEPDVTANPLPNHGGRNVNAIEEECGRKTKQNATEIKSPMRWVFQQLCMARLIDRGIELVQKGAGAYCEFHQKYGHDIQCCEEFRQVIQNKMDNKEIEFFERMGGRKIADVCTFDNPSGKYNIERPFVISPKAKEEIQPQEGISGMTHKMLISAPTPFPFKNAREVPWSYTANISTPEGSKLQIEKEHITKEKSALEAEPKEEGSETVNEAGHFTRSGRCYSPETVKDPKMLQEKQKKLISEKIFGEEPSPKINEPVTEEQAQEFLRFLKHSEYDVVEQLKKLPARISILELLLSSEKHRDALLKVLNQTFVPNDITINKLDRIVNHIAADNYITFTDDEIPEGGMGSTKALNITTQCKGYILPGVLIDNGSALNVLPMMTLQRLPIDSSHMKSCQNTVRAFDGTQRTAIGKIEIPLLVGPIEYNIEFVVMDIRPTYNCLLGRPWIHSAGAVPSSLHQKLKFVIEGKLVSIDAEQDIIASVTSDAPYIQNDEEAVECSFRALDFVNATFVAEGNKISRPRLSNCTKMTVRETLGRGAKKGKGLGRNLQGSLRPRGAIGKRDRFGLGYKPNFLQRKQEWKKKEERRKARFRGEDIPWGPITFPKIKEHFVFGGITNVEQKVKEAVQENDKLYEEELLNESIEGMFVNMVNEGGCVKGLLAGIRPCFPGEVLSNWSSIDLPVVFRTRSE
ncbi:hypothetical protein V6N11_007163 [Hibiscus sabdariffa]|uniref:G-patch domain-containing protein n=1 Tax=Hibiscus sabdariffa TaxID=183260 RepID=A0ABR2RSY8_9ROSI